MDDDQRSARGITAFPVVDTSITDLQSAMESGLVTSALLVDAYLARIRAYDQAGPRLNAVLWINPQARAEAEALDLERSRTGARGPLHGIPVVVKDNFEVRDMPTSAGTLGLAGLVSRRDAFQVRKLREAGALILAKTNLHELAAGITTVSSIGGQTRNPYDPTRNPGGSSGGTAAAVAASFAALGWGSDTCGSIRIPAAHTALYGLRPTKGVSSVAGIVPLSHTQDVAGPLARTVADLAVALDATVGPDPEDPATMALPTLGPPPSFVKALREEALEGRRIGVLSQRFGWRSAGEREISEAVRSALARMEQTGAHLIEIEIEELDELVGESSLIAHEFKFDLMDYLARLPEAPTRSLAEILDGGLYHRALEARFRTRNRPLSRDTVEARAARAKQAVLSERLTNELSRRRLDAIAFPTVRRPPARLGEPQSGSSCRLAAHTGLPSISLPVGFTRAGLPIGMELLGPALSDPDLVSMAHAFELTGPHRRHPDTTPELVGGQAPAPRSWNVSLASQTAAGTARFTYDVTKRVLSFDVRLDGIRPDRMLGVALGRGTSKKNGAVLHRLAGPGELEATGSLRLTGSEVARLESGTLVLRLFTRDHPLDAARQRVHLPAVDTP